MDKKQLIGYETEHKLSAKNGYADLLKNAVETAANGMIPHAEEMLSVIREMLPNTTDALELYAKSAQEVYRHGAKTYLELADHDLSMIIDYSQIEFATGRLTPFQFCQKQAENLAEAIENAQRCAGFAGIKIDKQIRNLEENITQILETSKRC